jgi:hypothetical protein
MLSSLKRIFTIPSVMWDLDFAVSASKEVHIYSKIMILELAPKTDEILDFHM